MAIELLVVEDDAYVRAILEPVLTRAGYRVSMAPDAMTAIGLLAPTAIPSPDRFAVVLSDIQLGDATGLDVLTVARLLKPPPEVILLTGHASLDTAINALRKGAFDYLLKPFVTQELLECVARAVEQSATVSRQADAIRTISEVVNQLQGTPASEAEQSSRKLSRYLRVGELVLDRHRHNGLFRNEPVKLTPIEFELLLCLAELEGQVVNYADIVRRTHSTTVDKGEAQNMLKVYIHNLRRKLEPGYLINVRGTGYMLVEPDPMQPAVAEE